MSVSINLVNQKNPNQDKQEKVHKIRGIAYSLLAITALIVLIIFSLEYRFSASYVKKQQAQLLAELDQYSDKSAKFYIISASLTEIESLLAQRNNYQKTTKEIFNVKPSDMLVSEYKYDESGVSLTVITPSLGSVDSFLNSLIDLTQKKVITGVVLQNLSLVEGNYSMELLMQ